MFKFKIIGIKNNILDIASIFPLFILLGVKIKINIQVKKINIFFNGLYKLLFLKCLLLFISILTTVILSLKYSKYKYIEVIIIGKVLIIILVL